MSINKYLSENEIYISQSTKIPQSLIYAEMSGLYGTRILREMGEIIKYYNVYEKGAEFVADSSKLDYVAADLKIHQTAYLINKEARFLFSKQPDIFIEPELSGVNPSEFEAIKDDISLMQAYVDRVFEKTRFFGNLLKAAKDCFIGKRVACFVNFNEDIQKIQINFSPSLEFVYETDPDDIDVLTKIVCFYTTVDSDNKANQRIYKKKYWMNDDGFCWIEEGMYDGVGRLIEEITPERATKFTYIPAVIIRNDGLTGDLDGESEVKNLQEYESWMSRLNSADIDAERQGMNSIKYTVDMSPESTQGLSIAPGAFWDLSSDQNADSPGSVGTLESSMGYSGSLDATLKRIKASAYNELDIPDTSPDAMQGVVTSGKTLKAMYWGLIVRCDEKMQEWRPALEKITRILIDGAHLYPKSTTPYSSQPIPDRVFNVKVDNQYSLPEDEQEEKQIDLAEVNAQTMSKKAYMKKWRNLTDDEAEQELKQIALERQLLEDSMSNMPPVDMSDMYSDDSSESGNTGQISEDLNSPQQPTSAGE